MNDTEAVTIILSDESSDKERFLAYAHSNNVEQANFYLGKVIAQMASDRLVNLVIHGDSIQAKRSYKKAINDLLTIRHAMHSRVLVLKLLGKVSFPIVPDCSDPVASMHPKSWTPKKNEHKGPKKHGRQW